MGSAAPGKSDGKSTLFEVKETGVYEVSNWHNFILKFYVSGLNNQMINKAGGILRGNQSKTNCDSCGSSSSSQLPKSQ